MSMEADNLSPKAGRPPSYAETSGSEHDPRKGVPESEPTCWVCGGPVVERHCKIVCRVCGFTRDCSDP